MSFGLKTGPVWKLLCYFLQPEISNSRIFKDKTMKKYLLMAAAAMMAATTVFAAGDEKNGHAYFTKAELPDMTKILPPFPEFESARFVADQSQHLWGKLMRQDEARAAQAQNDDLTIMCIKL